MPVMIPAAGASPSYIPCAASGLSSRNGDPRSRSVSTRSRGSSLPRPACRSRELGGPPRAAAGQVGHSANEWLTVIAGRGTERSYGGLTVDFSVNEDHAALRVAVAEVAGDFGHQYYIRKAQAREAPAELWAALGKQGF